MLIRIISDLHLDVNKSYPFSLVDKNIFTLICGDISGDNTLTTKWLKDNLKGGGLFVAGNHIVYNNRYLTLQELKEELAKEFPIENDITFLDVSTGVFTKEIDGILFLGSTLYTDYKVMPLKDHSTVEINKRYSENFMTDFRYGLISRQIEHGLLFEKQITPDDYVKRFNETILKFEEVLSENEKSENPKHVVVLTHHAPSESLISEEYKDSFINSSFTSNLDDFIEKHTSIKLWTCGHMHTPKIVELYRKDNSMCKLVLNPRGYCYREGKDFTQNLFINTETWEIIKK